MNVVAAVYFFKVPQETGLAAVTDSFANLCHGISKWTEERERRVGKCEGGMAGQYGARARTLCC